MPFVLTTGSQMKIAKWLERLSVGQCHALQYDS